MKQIDSTQNQFKNSELEQIEEMARDIFETGVAIDGIDLAFASVYGADNDSDTHFMRIAKQLYKKGYRKQSDVAREIFEELIEKLELISIVAQPTDGFTQGVIKTFNKTSALIAELKKKYTEGKI